MTIFLAPRPGENTGKTGRREYSTHLTDWTNPSGSWPMDNKKMTLDTDFYGTPPPCKLSLRLKLVLTIEVIYLPIELKTDLDRSMYTLTR